MALLGAAGIDRHPHQHAGHRAGRHRQGALSRRAAAGRPLGRREARVGSARLLLQARPGLRQEMANRPQTLYGIADSPVGLAAWMLDHDARSYALIARVFDGQPEGLTRDDILDNVTLYWLTNTAVSSARLYWESKLAFFAPKGVAIPAAVSVFPDEIYPAPRESGRSRRIPNSSTTTGSRKAATSRPGNSRSSSSVRCRGVVPLPALMGARGTACARGARSPRHGRRLVRAAHSAACPENGTMQRSCALNHEQVTMPASVTRRGRQLAVLAVFSSCSGASH